MSKRSSMMSKLMVFMLTLAVVFTYSVMPMTQAYAASAKPAKVTIKEATPVSTTSFKVTWKKAKSAKKYQVYVSTKKNKGFKKVATTGKTSYTVKKLNKKALKVGKKYYVKVRGFNGKATGKWSKVKTVSTFKKPSEKAPTLGESKTATMSTYIDMSKYEKGKVVKVWVPIPQDDEFQKITDVVYTASGTAPKVTTETENGNKMLYLEWGKDVEPKDRKASLVFTGTRVEVKRTELKNNSKVAIPASAKKYINRESEYVKVKAPIVQEYALKATKGKTTTLGKARAIYDWTIANLERIDNGEELVNAKGEKHVFAVEGCGYGDTVRILTDLKTFGRAGGHCTDINSTFVALCRAAGIPAREMFGIRMNEDATGGQHCWAEFYLPGTGWVYADPADVLKAIRPKSGATVDEIKAAKASDIAKEKTAYFWGGVDNNRIVISRGRDVTFNPPQAWGKCNTFGYPAAEVDGQRIPDFTNAKEFVYKIDCLDYSKIDKTSEGWGKLGVKEVDLANDFVIDVRPADNEEANKSYAKGHFVGSESFPVPSDYSKVDKAGLKALYDKAAGKRVVIVCVSGKVLAGNAMQALKESGAYMPNVTYLIGGATGVSDDIKADTTKWAVPN
ncbi:MAG: fibronectin type III domain-containing protein [Mogibacterium sp.]|nr:fibronectin type III domain-containing protein [Mogibacterium sp.]